MTELKPCPFCGWSITAFNEDLYRVNISGNDHWVHLRCAHCGATAQGHGNTKEAAEHQAQDRWNTRAERTCKWTQWEQHSDQYFSTECGREFQWATPYDLPNYCPGCGAKLVSE